MLKSVNFDVLSVGLVTADFARRLERERDAVREQYQTTHLLANSLAKTQVELKAERDEAREQIKGWELKWKCAVEMAALAQNKLEAAK